MNTPSASPVVAAPSIARLVTTTIVALIAAGVILVNVVLPAEYGIDPLGTGRWLGLTAIATPPTEATIPVPESAAVAMTPVPQGPIGRHGAEYKVDAIDLVLGPYEYVEYKYRLEKGATMLFTWKADAAPIYDFHADPDGSPAPDPVSFDTESKREASGTFTAPFSGIHGWFWENPGGEPLTIRLRTAGFYSSAIEFRSNRTRRTHEPANVSDRRPGGG